MRDHQVNFIQVGFFWPVPHILLMFALSACHQPHYRIYLRTWNRPFIELIIYQDKYYLSSYNWRVCVQQARKWLFRPNFFPHPNEFNFCMWPWTQWENIAPYFFLLYCFSFSRNLRESALAANARFADSIVWKNKSCLWKRHRQEKNSFFAYVICGKWKRNQQT